MIEEPCISGPKHYSPFRCEVVPKSFIIELIKRYPRLCKIAYFDEHMIWMNTESSNRYFNLMAHKKYVFSVANKKLTAIFQRVLNYEKSTLSGQHIHSRFGRVYREYIEMDWYRGEAGKWEFVWNKEKLKALTHGH